MANILVTGGAGYVGSVCCAQLLDRGHSVTVVDDLSTGHREAVPPAADFHRVDVGDRAAMATLLARNRFDAVFHFAAKALIAQSVQDPGVFFATNLASGISFLEALRSAGIRRLVFSSSAAVYGNPVSTPIAEDDRKEPVNSYGASKLMLEQVLRWYAEAYRWSVVALRYFNASGAVGTLGERHDPETHVIPLLLQAADGERDCFEIYGTDYNTPDGTCLRDYVHVLDIAEAHVLALNVLQQPGLRIYNLGSGRSCSVREVCEVVQQVVGRRIPIVDSGRRLGDPAILRASPRRAQDELGWKPQHSDLKEIVLSAWHWKQTYGNRRQRRPLSTTAN